MLNRELNPSHELIHAEYEEKINDSEKTKL